MSNKVRIRTLGYRRSASRVTECSFECIAKLVGDSDIEDWQLIVTNPTHNHESILSVAHSIHRRNAMTDEVLKEVAKGVKQGDKTSKILGGLRMDHDEENPQFKARDIYNARAFIRLEELGSLTSTQTLMRVLSNDEKWFMRVQTDAQQKIQHLFYTSNCMQKILLENAELLLMDCIYKTNRYKMSLLIIIGVINLNTSFYVGFCFMKSEHTKNYIWALEAVKELYKRFNLSPLSVILTDDDKAIPSAIRQVFESGTAHLLCIWHLEQNIVENCSKFFEIKKDMQTFMKSFKQLFYISSEAALKEKYNELYFLWLDVDVNLAQYLNNNI